MANINWEEGQGKSGLHRECHEGASQLLKYSSSSAAKDAEVQWQALISMTDSASEHVTLSLLAAKRKRSRKDDQ